MPSLRAVSTLMLSATIALSMFCACSPSDRSSVPESTTGQTTENSSPILQRVKRDKTIRAGYIVYAPFVTKDPNTSVVGGYLIDLVNEVATQAGFDVQLEETTWGDMVPGIASGQFDIVISAIFPTIPRALEVSFTEPLGYMGIAGIVRKDESRIHTVADIGKPDIRLAVVNGESAHEYARRFFAEKKLTVLDTGDLSRGAEEVRSGNADLTLIDIGSCEKYAAQYPDEVRMIFQDDPVSSFGVSLMLPQGDPEWKVFWDTSLAVLEASGDLDRIAAANNIAGVSWKPRDHAW